MAVAGEDSVLSLKEVRIVRLYLWSEVVERMRSALSASPN